MRQSEVLWGTCRGQIGNNKNPTNPSPLPHPYQEGKNIWVYWVGVCMLQFLIGLAEIRFAQLMAGTWIVGDTLKP
jgi:hypothetical protein